MILTSLGSRRGKPLGRFVHHWISLSGEVEVEEVLFFSPNSQLVEKFEQSCCPMIIAAFNAVQISVLESCVVFSYVSCSTVAERVDCSDQI